MLGTTCSAPGKVLLAGGYLILDRPHSGLVLALDARFYSRVELHEFMDAAAAKTPATSLLIEVHSPQFDDERRYVYEPTASTPLAPTPRADGAAPPPTNRYVEVPLLYGLTLLSELRGSGYVAEAVKASRAAGWASLGGTVGLRVTLAADNAFYSHAAELRARGWTQSAASLRALPSMLPPRRDEEGEMAKTGLGSSATLVTSLLAALLGTFGAISLPGEVVTLAVTLGATSTTPTSLALLHSLAQLCHCAAQGKVGSGFDVCSATYGSQRCARRRSPRCLAHLQAPPTMAPTMSSDGSPYLPTRPHTPPTSAPAAAGTFASRRP